jgi:hypothetical protein
MFDAQSTPAAWFGSTLSTPRPSRVYVVRDTPTMERLMSTRDRDYAYEIAAQDRRFRFVDCEGE